MGEPRGKLLKWFLQSTLCPGMFCNQRESKRKENEMDFYTVTNAIVKSLKKTFKADDGKTVGTLCEKWYKTLKTQINKVGHWSFHLLLILHYYQT